MRKALYRRQKTIETEKKLTTAEILIGNLFLKYEKKIEKLEQEINELRGEISDIRWRMPNW